MHLIRVVQARRIPEGRAKACPVSNGPVSDDELHLL